MHKFYGIILAFALSIFSSSSFAGLLSLTNGDRLSGELEALTDSGLIWSSDSFGSLDIELSAIDSMQSNTQLDELVYNGQSLLNCSAAVNDGILDLDCSQGGAIALAADDVLPTPPVAPVPTHSGEIKAGFSKRSGNTDSSSLDVASNAIYENDIAVHNFWLDIDREESNGLTTKEQYAFDYQADFPVVGNWITFARAGYDEDKFASIMRQYDAGVGVGYRPMILPNLTVDTNLGIDYVVSEFQDGSESRGAAGRWGLNSEWEPGYLNLTFFHNHSYTVPFKDTDEYQIETSTGVKIPLMESLFAELRYDYDYDGNPVPGSSASDREWIFSLGYGW